MSNNYEFAYLNDDGVESWFCRFERDTNGHIGDSDAEDDAYDWWLWKDGLGQLASGTASDRESAEQALVRSYEVWKGGRA